MSNRMREMMMLAAALGLSTETMPGDFRPKPPPLFSEPPRGSRGNKYTPHQGKRECARRKAKS